MFRKKWADATAKEQSEAIKNIATAIGIAVGGGWILFQWNVLFPQTEADVLVASASIRADVSGTLSISVGDDGASGTSFTDFCQDDQSATNTLSAWVSGNFRLTSASKLPLNSYFREVLVLTADSSEKVVAIEGDTTPEAIELVELSRLGTVSPKAIVGGLSENRVEQGQSIQSSFVFRINLPFSCTETEKLVVFQANFDIVPVDPRSGEENTDDAVRKVVISACQIQPYGYGACNIDRISAYGQ